LVFALFAVHGLLRQSAVFVGQSSSEVQPVEVVCVSVDVVAQSSGRTFVRVRGPSVTVLVISMSIVSAGSEAKA
jgi:hypothetical protein